MKQRKNDQRKVYQSFAMVMQFGLNMIVPIGMMSALGVWLDGKLSTSWITILFFVIGAVAGGQNVYRCVMGMFDTEETDGERVRDEVDRSSEKDE